MRAPRSVLVLTVLTLALVAGSARRASGQIPIRPEAKELFAQAMEQHRNHDVGRALDSYLRAYHADPSILALDDQGLLDTIVAFLKARLAKDPTDVSHTYKLAEIFSLKGELQESLDYYTRVQQLNATSPLALAAKQASDRIRSELAASMPAPTAPAASPGASPGASASPSPATTSAEDWQSQVDSANAKAKGLQKQVDDLQAQVDEDKKKLDDKDKQIEELNKKVIMYNNYRLGVLPPVVQP